MAGACGPVVEANALVAHAEELFHRGHYKEASALHAKAAALFEAVSQSIEADVDGDPARPPCQRGGGVCVGAQAAHDLRLIAQFYHTRSAEGTTLARSCTPPSSPPPSPPPPPSFSSSPSRLAWPTRLTSQEIDVTTVSPSPPLDSSPSSSPGPATGSMRLEYLDPRGWGCDPRVTTKAIQDAVEDFWSIMESTMDRFLSKIVEEDVQDDVTGPALAESFFIVDPSISSRTGMSPHAAEGWRSESHPLQWNPHHFRVDIPGNEDSSEPPHPSYSTSPVPCEAKEEDLTQHARLRHHREEGERAMRDLRNFKRAVLDFLQEVRLVGERARDAARRGVGCPPAVSSTDTRPTGIQEDNMAYVQHLEEKVKELESQNMMLNKYRERWDDLKRSAREKKLARKRTQRKEATGPIMEEGPP